MRGPQPDAPGARGKLGDDGRNDRPLGLARAIGVEGPQDHDGQIEGGEEGMGQLVGRDLACRIGGLTDQRMAFVNRHILRSTVDLTRRRLDEAPHVRCSGRLEQVHGAPDIGVHIGLRRVVGIGDRDQRGQVKDGIDPLHHPAHLAGIADVAGNDANLPADLFRKAVKPAGSAEAVVEHQRRDRHAQRHQPLDEMRTDEAVSAGDQRPSDPSGRLLGAGKHLSLASPLPASVPALPGRIMVKEALRGEGERRAGRLLPATRMP